MAFMQKKNFRGREGNTERDRDGERWRGGGTDRGRAGEEGRETTDFPVNLRYAECIHKW